MASKTRVNKTQLILDMLAKNPEATPMEIAEKLKSHKVTPAYVSNIKSVKKAGKRIRGKAGKSKVSRAGARRRGRRSADENISMASLVKAKELADELGGVERAKSLLGALARLTD